MEEAYTADFTVCRALLRPGRGYEEAVKRFATYEQVREAYPEAREALTSVVNRAREKATPTIIFVNNRVEGNAPGRIAGLIGGGEN
jgi:hypothetical protein